MLITKIVIILLSFYKLIKAFFIKYIELTNRNVVESVRHSLRAELYERLE